MIKNKILLLLIREVIKKLKDAKYFNKLDLILLELKIVDFMLFLLFFSFLFYFRLKIRG